MSKKTHKALHCFTCCDLLIRLFASRSTYFYLDQSGRNGQANRIFYLLSISMYLADIFIQQVPHR